MKRCTKCGAVKPVDEYNYASGGRHGVRGDCRTCQMDRYRDYYVAVTKPRRAAAKAARVQSIAPEGEG